MIRDYDFINYKADIEAAHNAYTKVVEEHCTFQGRVIPLDNHEIIKVKARALAIKNQMISAAGKRLRAAIAIRMLDDLKSETDMTYTLAVRVTKYFLGRSINREILLNRYATHNRTAAKKSKDLHRLEKIVAGDCFVSYEIELEKALEKAATIRDTVRDEKMKEKKAHNMLSKSSKAHTNHR